MTEAEISVSFEIISKLIAIENILIGIGAIMCLFGIVFVLITNMENKK